jgi:hypothetical protein
MHPDFLRELTSQHGREMRAQAQRSALLRMLRAARRGTKASDETDEFAVPAIPDYVDGSFRTTPADDTAGEVAAAQHAA